MPGDLAGLQPAGADQEEPVTGDDTVIVPRYRVGSNVPAPVTVTPYSRFPVPPGLAGTTSGAARTITANGIGAPGEPVLTLSST